MLRLFADENFNRDLIRGVLRRRSHLDLVRAQDVELSRTPDPQVLAWAAQEQRVTLSHDVTTMTRFADERIERGEPMAGLFLVHQQGMSFSTIIDDLLLLDDCSETAEWANQIVYLPLR